MKRHSMTCSALAGLLLAAAGCRVEEYRLRLLPAGEALYKLDDGDGFESWAFALALEPMPTELATAELSIALLRRGEVVGEERFGGRALAAHLGVARGVGDGAALVDFCERAPTELGVDALQLALRHGRRRGRLTVPLVTYAQATPLRLPVDGCWLVASGHHRFDEHRRWYNRAHFAYDLVRVNERGEPRAEGAGLTDSYAYGAPIVAPAPGLVRLARDDFPDAPLGEPRPADETNFLLLELERGEQLKLAHLQPGSLTVRPGERVVTGQRLARVGNSGASDAPHLHVHLQRASVDAQGIITAEFPLPLAFSDYRLTNQHGVGQAVAQGSPRRGDFVCAE